MKELKAVGLEAFLNEIESLCVECTTAELSSDIIEQGSSKIGGHPDVPADFEWPFYRGLPLEFLLQLNCAEVNSPILPSAGYLLFFYCDGVWADVRGEKDFIRIIYIPVDVALSNHQAPGIHKKRFWGLLKPKRLPSIYPESKISFKRSFSLPDLGEYPYEELKIFDEDDYLLDAYCTLKENLTGSKLLQISGYPNPVQYDGITEDAARVMSKGKAEDWQLLLELNSLGGFMWGDAGRLYFSIHNEDLAQLKFSDVWMQMQCH
ncbi:YwqG family protein [Microbulbifer sp. ANSA003]|uniref:YwqG family protein n=1 Tax=Microbulbifer sp. ANSA003 TaxID=3243360 RepID=UPI004041A5C2